MRLANESGRTKTQIARELDVSRAMLYSWVKTCGAQGQTAFNPSKVKGNTEIQELKRLRLENKQLREVIAKAINNPASFRMP